MADKNYKLSFELSDGSSKEMTFTAPQGPQGDKGETGAAGADGQRGTGILKVTTAPTAETSTVDGYDYKYKINISTVISQAGVSEVLVGDVLKYSYYEYGIGYMDDTYAYAYTRTSIRGTTGATGAAGKDGATAAEVIAALSTETWAFTLADGSTVDKVVPLV